MTPPLKLHSERYTASGGAGGDAARRALGKPKLDRMSVLIRESVQNSWDARCSPGKASSSIKFTAVLERFSGASLGALKNTVFAEIPSGTHPIREYLREGFMKLILEDRNTVGLGGAVFKDSPFERSEPRNFVRFFRDIGRAEQSSRGGGTYGYGKSVFFNASHASTVVVNSRFRDNSGKLENRLMAMSLWSASEDEVLTGRHWWGVADSKQGGAVGPVTGADCVKLSSELGFSPFEDDETGTSFMIIAPNVGTSGQEDLSNIGKRIAETMVFWYWPRMLGGFDNSGRVDFKVYCEGNEIVVPDPEKTVPFRTYAYALRSLVRSRLEGVEPELPNKIAEIRSERPKAGLGWLSLSLAPYSPRPQYAAVAVSEHPLHEQLKAEPEKSVCCRHVALVRSPGQVIRYLPTKTYPDPAFEYAGVFMLDTDPGELEQEFIDAEPPSHDDWVAPERGSMERSVVRIAKRRIREVADQFAESGRLSVSGGLQEPLGAISADLGQLLSAEGTGPKSEIEPSARNGDGRRGGGRRVKIQMDKTGYLEERGGGRLFVLGFDVSGEIPEAGAKVTARAKVVVAGGSTESEAPAGSFAPKIVGWRKRSPGSKELKVTDLEITPADLGEWEVVVSVPHDAAISVSLAIENK